MVDDAIVRGEIPAGTDAMAVVHMLLAMFWGMSFYAGFIADENDMVVIAEQLHQLMTHGLLAQQEIGRALTIRHAWPGLTGSSSSRRSFLKERGRSRPTSVLFWFVLRASLSWLGASKQASGSRLGRSPTA